MVQKQRFQGLHLDVTGSQPAPLVAVRFAKLLQPIGKLWARSRCNNWRSRYDHWGSRYDHWGRSGSRCDHWRSWNDDRRAPVSGHAHKLKSEYARSFKRATNDQIHMASANARSLRRHFTGCHISCNKVSWAAGLQPSANGSADTQTNRPADSTEK